MKKQTALCLILGILALTAFSGCQKSDGNAQVNASSQTADQSGEKTDHSGESDGSAGKNETDKVVNGTGTTGEKVVGETDSAGKSYTADDKFSYKEIENVFRLSKADVIALCGEPVKSTKSDFEDVNVETLEYEEELFDVDFTLDPENGKVFNAQVSDDKLGLPRGIKIGDPIEQVVTKFPYQQTDVIVSEGDGRGYIKMYGDPTSGGAYGIVQMDGETPTDAIYADEMTSVTFQFKQGMVTSVTYTLKIN